MKNKIKELIFELLKLIGVIINLVVVLVCNDEVMLAESVNNNPPVMFLVFAIGLVFFFIKVRSNIKEAKQNQIKEESTKEKLIEEVIEELSK